MTYEQLETGKKIQESIRANERVLEHFRAKKTELDKIGVLVNFFTNCNNLHGSLSKKELAEMLYGFLVQTIEVQVKADQEIFENL